MTIKSTSSSSVTVLKDASSSKEKQVEIAKPPEDKTSRSVGAEGPPKSEQSIPSKESSKEGDSTPNQERNGRDGHTASTGISGGNDYAVYAMCFNMERLFSCKKQQDRATSHFMPN